MIEVGYRPEWLRLKMLRGQDFHTEIEFSGQQDTFQEAPVLWIGSASFTAILAEGGNLAVFNLTDSDVESVYLLGIRYARITIGESIWAAGPIEGL